MMSSHEIGSMAMNQAAMFGNFQSYAQQITPPYGAGPGMGYGAPAMGGYSSGNIPAMPPPPPPMPGFSPHQGGMMGMAAMMPYAAPTSGLSMGIGNQIAGSAFGGLASAAGGLSTMAQYGTTVAGGLSMLGIGGTGMAMAGGLAGGAVAGGLAAGAYGAGQLYQGFQERQNIGRVLQSRFGGQFGIGSGQQGFTNQEIGQMSSMVRAMGAEDSFTSMEELTRVMDKTAQMGLYRGVESARQFKEKFQQTVDSLKEISKVMHTSLEGATQFMEGQRNMGFFSGADITRSLMRTKLNAGASGMSMQQMQQIGMQGTQMGRMMGMRGQTGATAMMEMATNIGVGMQIGSFDDEMIAEATGGLTGAEGAQALAGQMMQTNNRWLSRGAGRVMSAALWDPETGGVNQQMLQRAMRGGMSFQDLRRAGRENISASGGRRSEFFLNQKRFAGELMAQGGGYLMTGMLGQHIAKRRGLDLDDPIVQRWVQRQTGKSQSEVEFQLRKFQEMPRILEERASRTAMNIESQARTRAREGAGLSGVRRNWAHWWEQEVDNPMREKADMMTTSITSVIDRAIADMEGSVKTVVSERTKRQLSDFAESGKISEDMSFARFQKLRSGLKVSYDEGGFMGSVGRFLGSRGPSMEQRLENWGASGIASGSQRGFLDNINQQFNMTGRDFGFSSSQMGDYGSRAKKMVLSHIGTGAAFQDFRKRRAGFGDMSGSKKRSMMDERIGLLRQDPVLDRMFSKARGRPQQYAMLREVQNRMGFSEGSEMGVPVEEFGGGRSYEQLRAELDAADKAYESSSGDMADALLGGFGKDWAYTYDKKGFMQLMGFTDPTKRKVEGDEFRELRRKADEGGRTSGYRYMSEEGLAGARKHLRTKYAGSLASMMGNEKVSELLIKASEGDTDALSTLSDMATNPKAATRAGVDDVETLGRVVQKLRDKDEAVKEVIGHMSNRKNLRELLGVYQTDKERGVALRKSLRNNEKIINAANKVGPEAMDALSAIAEAQAGGNWDEAERLRRDFYGDYAGKEGVIDLIGQLSVDASAGSLGRGLGRTARLMRRWKGPGGGRLAFRDAMESEVGLNASDFGGSRNMNRLARKALSKGGMSAEQLWEQLDPEVRRSGKLSFGQFKKQVDPWLSAMKAGLTDDERMERAVGEGAEFASKDRMSGSSKTRVTLAEKQVTYLSQMVKLTKLQLSATERNAPPTADEIAAAMGPLGGGGNGETGNPSGGATKKGGTG